MKSKLSSSLLLVLLCLGAFHFNQVQAATCDTSKTNCATCSGTAASDNCLTCNAGYYIESNACVTCTDKTKYLPTGKTTAADCVAGPANCAETNSDGTGTCKKCSDFYILSSDKKTCGTCSDKAKSLPAGKTLDTECVACVTAGTCTECNVFGTCKTCPANYALTDAGKSCKVCSDTTKYLPVGKTKDYECVSCGTGCKTCSIDGTKCLTCNDGYYLESDKCKTCADATKYLPTGKSTAADCVAGPANCLQTTADGTGKCQTCKTNYYIDTDGKSCKTCTDTKTYVPVGKSAPTDCVACTLKCSACNIDGTCTACESGRYLKNGLCVPCATGCSTCDSTGKCTGCNAKFAFDSTAGTCTACPAGCNACDTKGKCSACVDATYAFDSTAGTCTACPAGCATCDTKGKCLTCTAGFYLSSDACKTCGVGCSACGTNGICTACVTSGYVLDSNKICQACPTGCTECNADTRACTKCDTNFSYSAGICTACPAGTYAAIANGGQQAASTCLPCDVGKYYSTSTKACATCDDANCWSCSGAGVGHCLACKSEYTLVRGTCTAPGTTIKKTGSVIGNIRLDMDMDTYNKFGGANHFVGTAAKALNIPADLIEVTGTQKGSVIVLFRIFSSGTLTAADIRTNLNSAIASGVLGQTSNLFGGVVVMDSNAVVLLPNGCPSGQYYDAENYVCRDCTDDICGKKKSKVGPILGGVLGGIALILIIAIIVAKKTNLFAKKAQSPKSASAQYNLAANSPTNPTVENERV